MTIVLTIFGVGSYVRYQQLAADARTASANLDKLENYFGQSDRFNQIGLLCDGYSCFIVDRGNAVVGEKDFEVRVLASGPDITSTDITGIHIKTDRLRFVSPSGGEVRANLVYGPDDNGKLFIGAATPGKISPFERIDFLDDAGQTVFSIPSGGSLTEARMAADSAADVAAQAAKDAMMNLVAVGGGALLTFLAMSVLGWMATRRRVASRRAPQRRGTADSGIRQQSSGGQAWMDRVTMGLLASALRALDHPDDQDRYREEWAADYDEIQGTKQRLRWALLLRLFAPMGIRSARRDALAMSPPQQQ
jgi:uncharacterized protein (DUF779 family)